MRRKDREVTDFNSIIKIIDRCDIIRIGLTDGDYPYIVPVNFAYETDGENLNFYIHGAETGRKYGLMKKNGVCSFEIDNPICMECIPERKDVTMRYESVMGKATLVFLDGNERRNAIDNIIMARYPETEKFEYNKNAVEHTAVVKLCVTELTAKANLPHGDADI